MSKFLKQDRKFLVSQFKYFWIRKMILKYSIDFDETSANAVVPSSLIYWFAQLDSSSIEFMSH